jgi:hypothetical protein
MKLMENTAVDFLPALVAALALRSQWLQTTVVPELNDDLRSIRALVDSVFGTLVKKGMLKEEHYGYDERPSGIALPPDMAIPESSEMEVAGSRLAAYRRQLDLLVDPAAFGLDRVDLAALAAVSSILSYVDWTGFEEASPSSITRTLARMVLRVRLSPDVLSARVLHESQSKLQEIMPRARARLAEIERWARESWKAEYRARVLPRAGTPGSPRPSVAAEDQHALRKIHGEVFPGKPWHKELALEVDGEDRAEDCADRRRTLLSSLEIPLPAAAPGEKAAARRNELMSSLRALCQIATDIAAAESILALNEGTLLMQKRGLFQRLLSWLLGGRGEAHARLYDVSLRESPKAEPRPEKIDFLRFIAELRELNAVLTKLADESGADGSRLLAMTEEELCGLMAVQIRQVRHAYRKMEALNELFQLQAASRPRGSAQSIRLELLRMENGIARAEKGCGPDTTTPIAGAPSS